MQDNEDEQSIPPEATTIQDFVPAILDPLLHEHRTRLSSLQDNSVSMRPEYREESPDDPLPSLNISSASFVVFGYVCEGSALLTQFGLGKSQGVYGNLKT